MNDQKLNKFDWALAKRVYAMTKPYWASSGPNQKWLLAGYLVFMLAATWGLYIAFGVITGDALKDMWPGALVNLLPAELAASNKGLFAGLMTVISLSIPTLYLFFTRKVMDTGWRLLGILITLLLAVNGLNVVLTFCNRDLINALQVKDAPASWSAITILGTVFLVGIPIVVLYRFVRDKLAIAWRNWFTQDILSRYFANRKYYEISQLQTVENPDQRVSEDVRAFCSGALGFVLVILDSILTVLSFAAVLWAISPLLSYTVIGYALVGTVITILFGRRLIGLNYKQEEVEANFRYQAVTVRNNAEAIAFYSGEEMEKKSIFQRFGEAVKNYNFVIRWQRNLAFFTQGYDYLVVVLPFLVLMPIYLAANSTITFGDIMQANSAFGQLLAAFSLFVAQFAVLSGFAANVNRLSGFMEELKPVDKTPTAEHPRIKFGRTEKIALTDVTMMTPNFERTLAAGINATVEPGDSMLIVGPSGSGKSSLLRVIGNLWDAGSGQCTTPNNRDMLFLPQMPYLPLGSLRWQLTYPDPESTASDAKLREVLNTVNLPGLIEKYAKEGGLEAVLPWADRLSPGERQRLAFARLILKAPKYAILDEASSALDNANEEMLYGLLKDRGTTVISVGHRDSLVKHHSKVLQLDGLGGWRLWTAEDYAEHLRKLAEAEREAAARR